MTSIRDVALEPPAPMTRKRLTDDQVAAFGRDGLLYLPGLFSADEVGLLKRRLTEARDLDTRAFYVLDTDGQRSELIGWSGCRDDLLGAWVRVARLVESAEDLLDGQAVYHWHSKLSFKAPGSAGRWDWHQDYGSWYREGCLQPTMLTATVALDPCDQQNGCLKLVRGSHRMGRIDHGQQGEASGADPVVVAEAQSRLETIDCDLAPGDCVFFHGNTLHASGPNQSDQPRTLLHVSYNAVANQPARGQDWHAYRPLEILSDAALSDEARWGKIETGSLHRPQRPKEDRGVYGYQIELKVPDQALK